MMYKGTKDIEKTLDKLEEKIIETGNSQLRNAFREINVALKLHGITIFNKYPIFWDISDVCERALKNGVELSKKDAHEILEYAVENHDPNVGINWTVIDELIKKWSE